MNVTISDKDLAKVTRFEVIDESERLVVRHDTRVSLSLQDEGRTLKAFISGGGSSPKRPYSQRREDTTLCDSASVPGNENVIEQ